MVHDVREERERDARPPRPHSTLHSNFFILLWDILVNMFRLCNQKKVEVTIHLLLKCVDHCTCCTILDNNIHVYIYIHVVGVYYFSGVTRVNCVARELYLLSTA